MMKKMVTLLLCFLASVAVVVGLPLLFNSFTGVKVVSEESQETGRFAQKVTAVRSKPHEVKKLYSSGAFIGVISSEEKLNAHLRQVYHDIYEEYYPDTKAALGRDVYVTTEQSYYDFSDVDDEILNYLDENSLYTLEATQVSIVEDGKVKANIYVSDPDLYTEAMNEYLSFFIDEKALASITNGDTLPKLTNYGLQDIGISIAQTITTAKAFASPAEIRTTKKQVLSFLEYGDKQDLEYYTVQDYDTVAGVGARNYGLSATQVMNINRDKISSVDQVLKKGEKLCISYFESPLDVVVYKERLRSETIFFDTTYVQDESLIVGETQVRQEGTNGARNAMYTEKWINGVLTSGTLESSVETSKAVNEVVAVGTKENPGVGTGEWRYPVENPAITCLWGCYYGHRGTDFINAYDRWGDVYAMDSGVVKEVGYNGVSGNYIILDHNNGYETYYGHFRVPSELQVGQIVTKGDVVGHIGMSGVATGPHTHIYFNVNGERHNACEFLDCDSVMG